MDEKALVLWLEGPIQSWGSDSLFGRRDTQRFPTKSGIIGMLLSSLGERGPQRDLLTELSAQKHSVYSFMRKGQSRVLLRDFHMVGSGYEHKDPWENMFIPKTSEGKAAVGGGTKITYRYYLRDAFFGVIIKGNDMLINRVAEGLKKPVYDLYLGRKTCVPTEFIFQGVLPSHAEAKGRLMKIASEKGLTLFQTVLEGEHEGDVFSLNDVPVQFGNIKEYRDRMVTVIEE